MRLARKSVIADLRWVFSVVVWQSAGQEPISSGMIEHGITLNQTVSQTLQSLSNGLTPSACFTLHLCDNEKKWTNQRQTFLYDLSKKTYPGLAGWLALYPELITFQF